MTKWEYNVESLYRNSTTDESVEAWLHRMGEEGWEHYAVSKFGKEHERHYFKRPLPEGT